MNQEIGGGQNGDQETEFFQNLALSFVLAFEGVLEVYDGSRTNKGNVQSDEPIQGQRQNPKPRHHEKTPVMRYKKKKKIQNYKNCKFLRSDEIIGG